jgi:hypothetical protein
MPMIMKTRKMASRARMPINKVSQESKTQKEGSKERRATRTSSRTWVALARNPKSQIRTTSLRKRVRTNLLQGSRHLRQPLHQFMKVQRGTLTKPLICTIEGRRSAAKGEWS